jgi:hypothetical protein
MIGISLYVYMRLPFVLILGHMISVFISSHIVFLSSILILSSHDALILCVCVTSGYISKVFSATVASTFSVTCYEAFFTFLIP